MSMTSRRASCLAGHHTCIIPQAQPFAKNPMGVDTCSGLCVAPTIVLQCLRWLALSSFPTHKVPACESNHGSDMGIHSCWGRGNIGAQCHWSGALGRRRRRQFRRCRGLGVFRKDQDGAVVVVQVRVQRQQCLWSNSQTPLQLARSLEHVGLGRSTTRAPSGEQCIRQQPRGGRPP